MFSNRKIKRALLVFIFAPIMVQYTGLIPGTVGNGDWLGFWGSYLGIIPSGLIAWLVSSYQLNETNKIDRKNHIMEMYLDDLRLMRNKLLTYSFSGKWSSVYDIPQIGIDGQEIEQIKEILLKKVTDEHGDYYTTTEPWDIKLLAAGLPADKQKIFEPLANSLCTDIIDFTNYKEERFNDLAKKYNQTLATKTQNEEMAEKFDNAAKSWFVESDFVVKQLKKIELSYSNLEAKIKQEINDIYVLEKVTR